MAAAAVGPAQGQVLVARSEPAAGVIVAAKGGEELRLVREAIWRPAIVKQDVVAGDTLRTNAIGNLAIVFRDQTQLRVGRNSTLIVKSIGDPVTLELPAGAIWARANRGGTGVTIETPAATTAIRGTDWSVAVDGARTALAVYDGVVEFSNPYGSVTVVAGEAAVASIGSAPTKIVVVTPNDREQMLYYLDLRSAFWLLPPSPLERRAMRAERTRLAAVPPERRTADEWLTLAEVAITYDGAAAAQAAVDAARRLRLTRAERARADLVEAMIAGLARRYAEAVRLFDAAEPGLDGHRRAMAVYGRFFAAALADPATASRRPPPALAQSDASAALAEAWIAGFVEGPAAAIDILRAAEKRFPDDVFLPAVRARIAVLLDRRDEIAEAAARAEAIDPDDPATLDARSYVAEIVTRDSDAALADRRAAADLAPGNADEWNGVAGLESGRGADREAEAAYRRAIEADPYDALPRANYAILLLEQNRMAEAKAEIDRAAALDPNASFVQLARGRYELQMGEVKQALDSVLAASAANPASGNDLVLLAATYYENGDYAAAVQQLDNADRLDAFDPTSSLLRTIFALDHYEADQAILAAREAARRYRTRADYFSPIATTREGGSYVSSAFRFLTLNSWGRFYSDEAFDPFVASGYFDEAIIGQPRALQLQNPLDGPDIGEFAGPTSFSSLMQGLMIDPLAIASRNRWTDPIRRPFFDTTISAGTVWRDDAFGPTVDIDVNAFSNAGIPVSVFANVEGMSSPSDETNNRFDAASATLIVGANPTPYDRVVAFGLYAHDQPALPRTESFTTPNDQRRTTSAVGGAAWSHSFGYRHAVSTAVWVDHAADKADTQRGILIGGVLPGLLDVDNKANATSVNGAVAHAIGIGPVTIRSGVEASGAERSAERTDTLYTFVRPPQSARQTSDGSLDAGRVYVDALVRPVRNFQLEAAAFGSFMSGDTELARFDPRIAVGYMPIEGQWLRAGWRSDTEFPTRLTLSPVTTVGLVPNALPLDIGGRTQTAIARWDAEWTTRIFTSLEYQHQEVHKLSAPIPQTLDSLDVRDGRLDRVQATLNVWIGWGIGGFASYAYTQSEDTSDRRQSGRSLPYIPDDLATVGATWTHPAGFRVAVAESYVGEREGRAARSRLDPYWSTDVVASWVSPDRRLEADLSLFNLLDAEIENDSRLAAPGRTVLATFRAKF